MSSEPNWSLRKTHYTSTNSLIRSGDNHSKLLYSNIKIHAFQSNTAIPNINNKPFIII